VRLRLPSNTWTWIWLCILGCKVTPPVVRAPIAAACTTDRVGRVTVSGTDRGMVPALAVLEGTRYEPDRTERIVESATEALAWRGYARAAIRVTPRRRCFTDLDVAVTLGPRYRIASIEFDTDDTFPKRERLAALEDALGTVNTVGGVHIDYRLRRALSGLEKRYQDAGWLDAKVAAPVATYERDKIKIRIGITAGERYKIGSVRARGPAALRLQMLEELGLAEGAWYDAQVVRRGLDRARRAVGRPVELRTSTTDQHEIEIEAVVEARR
jgi:outer membrane protein assembly factor BamA